MEACANLQLGKDSQDWRRARFPLQIQSSSYEIDLYPQLVITSESLWYYFGTEGVKWGLKHLVIMDILCVLDAIKNYQHVERLLLGYDFQAATCAHCWIIYSLLLIIITSKQAAEIFRYIINGNNEQVHFANGNELCKYGVWRYCAGYACI